MSDDKKLDKEEDVTKNWPEFDPGDHSTQFDPKEYLKSFYATPDEEGAMKAVLFFLPGLTYRIPDGGTMLDVGSGPTVHVALSFRKRMKTIYLSDFAPQNRSELRKWWSKEEGSFNWTPIVKWISLIEADAEAVTKMEDEARSKLGGILNVDVYTPGVLLDEDVTLANSVQSFPTQFDVISTIYCLEYSTKTFDDYKSAILNVLTLLKPGGYFLMGGVFEENSYHFSGKKFRCHYLTKTQVFDCLQLGKINTKGPNFKFVDCDGFFILVGQKDL